tara:strand:+ start:3151 stop:3309 length:159 start_codon:yes stop_codon:yes gene_type:complete
MNVVKRWKEIIKEIKTRTHSHGTLSGGMKSYYNRREQIAALLVIAEVLQGDE